MRQLIVERKYNIRKRVTCTDIERLYEEPIDSNLVICIDNHKFYIQFVRYVVLDNKRISGGDYNNIYHINNVNSLS